MGIENGESTSLWYHHWVGPEPLYKLTTKEVPERISHWFVKDIIKDGSWNIEKVKEYLPAHIFNLIQSTPLYKNRRTQDYIRWTYSKDGNFTIKSAYALSFNSINSDHS